MLTVSDLREAIASAGAKAAFDTLVDGFSALSGFTVRAHEQGYLNSLRIYRGEDWCFSAVPNQNWVLAYIRMPELRRGQLTYEQASAAFPEARETGSGEITLRIADKASALRWLEMIQHKG